MIPVVVPDFVLHHEIDRLRGNLELGRELANEFESLLYAFSFLLIVENADLANSLDIQFAPLAPGPHDGVAWS